MKNNLSLQWLIIPLIFISAFYNSQAQPIAEKLIFNEFFNSGFRWIVSQQQSQNTHLSLTVPLVLAGFLCFIAASISSAGGIGGGGLFIPILIIVAGLDLKTASSFSAFMVTGGSFANVLYNMLIASSKCDGKRTLIDYDIALLSEPCMLLGVSIGVICNLMLPEWLIIILFAVFLAWSSFRTCTAGVMYWNFESEEVRRKGCGNLESGENCNGNEGIVKSITVPLLDRERKSKMGIPWMKLGILIMIWFSFLVVYLFRGNRYGQSVIPIKPCGVGYWILSSIQIPLAIVFTIWILYRRDNPNQQELGAKTTCESSKKLTFPIIAILAGALGGVFGIGGGMLISPLLLQVGISPQVTAATCSLMVFFSSTMSAVQYLLLGMEHTFSALIFTIICFVASLIVLMVVQKVIRKHGRPSLIVFSVGTVMVLSTVLMTSFGALDIWRDYTSGRYMGFKLPC